MSLRKLRWAFYLIMAWLALRLVRVLLWMLGYRKTVLVLARLSPAPRRAGYTGSMRVAARAIERVDGWWPNQPRGCLRRSLLFWWLFRWLGYSSEIRTGVHRGDGEFKLHAWVESRGIILNDRPVKVRQYEVLWDDISSRVIEAEGRQ